MNRYRLAKYIGANLNHHGVMVRQSARGDEAIDRHAAFTKHIHDPTNSTRRSFQECAIKMLGPVLQSESRERTVQVAIHQWRPATVEPVDAPYTLRPRRNGLSTSVHCQKPALSE